ncbi:phytanoyl-CoA dioxygenase family protein [Armatimonas sp.]|uniref:phytanoyl-CoA dioxygenase family protein n=1 Tax=Armatimonas sp. TaxID=1872638 RepID=UPI00286D4387|nr:phytanoyl-CoA dioxygenase family protein [Armatimonas sp.]
MQFREDQVNFFRTEGWLAVEGFWSEREVAAMRVELDRLKSEGKLRNIATEGDGKTYSSTKINLQLCPMWPHSELFKAMPFAPKAVAAIEALIGAPALLHLDQVFLKPGKQGAGTNWHQDNAYFQIPDPLKGTALWTAVHDATLANGTLQVIPRAFSELLPHERDGFSDHHIRCWPDETKAIPVELNAGGAIFFCYGTPHATGANTTEYERAGVALHFIHTDQSGVARSGFEPEKRPPLIADAAAWNAQVARVLA